tara:strand:+ start:310 stop:678 length:369 start_codon:yes stop_codon:yes gene_type:complete
MSTAAPAPDHNLIGQTIRGCEITEIIGQGTMGDVYRARQLSLNRNVAIKILATEYNPNPGFIRRFKREARAVARLVIQKKSSRYADADAIFQGPVGEGRQRQAAFTHLWYLPLLRGQSHVGR